MAVLQKIRDKNILLVSIIAFALLLFILSMSNRSCTDSAQSMTIGEVAGEELSLQDYQDLVQNYQFMYEMTNPNAQLSSEDAQNSINDQAWQSYVLNKMISKECEALGLAVTDDEVNKVLTTDGVTGNGQISSFLRLPVFMNPETMEYDPTAFNTLATELEKVKSAGQMDENSAKLYKYLAFAKQQIKNEMLANKYNSLLVNCMISNPVEAKMNFDQRTAEKDILLVSLPYAAIDDKEVNVSDKEIEDRFNQDKAKYATLASVCDAKVIDVFVTPSAEDKKAIENEFAGYYAELDSLTDVKEINQLIRKSGSDMPYTEIMKSANAFPSYITSLLDGSDSLTLSVGQTSKPAFNQMYNKYYTVKLLSKETQADSILHREILVTGADEKEKSTRADSIMNAIQAGGSFSAVAKNYGQQGDSAWISSAHFETARIDNADDRLFINSLYTLGAGLHKLNLQNGNILITEILASKNPITKYNVAIIDKPFNFSEKTYNEAFNKFSSFIASNKTIGEIEANAEKNGYSVQNITVPSNQHSIAQIHNTKDAIKWLYDEAKEGELSEIYRCGQNDHLMVVSLAGMSKDTYSVKAVKDHIKEELANAKKADIILKKLGGNVTIESAQKQPNASTDTLTHISLAIPAMVPATQTSEPMVSAIASKTAKGNVSKAFKGSKGVYVLKVLNDTKPETPETFDAKKEQDQMASQNLGMAMRTLEMSLMKKNKVKDTRYKFSM